MKFVRWLSVTWTGFMSLAFVIVPLGSIARLAWEQSPQTDSVARAIAWSSAVQAGWSTLIATVIGLALGLAVGSWNSNGSKRWGKGMEVLLAIPFGVPTVAAAIAWVAVLGRAGWLARNGWSSEVLYSLKAVVLAHVFFNAPWVALAVALARKRIPPTQIDVARSLGAGRWQVFRTVIWPQIGEVGLEASAQVFSFCVMSFALVLLLGGGPSVQTLETEIYARLRFGITDLSGAANCAQWQLGLTLLPWLLLWAVRGRRGALYAAWSPNENNLADNPKKNTAYAYGLILICAVFVLPYFSVIPNLIRIPWRSTLFWQVTQASVFLAFATSAVAVLTAVTALVVRGSVRSRGLQSFVDLLLTLPSGVSILVLGLGFWVCYSRWFDPFEGSWIAVALLQAVLMTPFAYRWLSSLARTIQYPRVESAISLGASPFQALWHVEWPRWRAPVLATVTLIAGAALGELGAVSLFYSENLVTLPLLIARWMSRYRFEDARAAAAFLIGVSCVMMAMGNALSERSRNSWTR